jgi:hypothetical protein
MHVICSLISKVETGPNKLLSKSDAAQYLFKRPCFNVAEQTCRLLGNERSIVQVYPSYLPLPLMHLGLLGETFLDLHGFKRRDFDKFEEKLAFRVEIQEAIESVRLGRVYGRTELIIAHVLCLEKWQHVDC